MYIANEEKVRELNKKRKQSMAEKLRVPLQGLAHTKGITGRLAARIDSYMSRKLDKGKGIYSNL